MKCPFCSYPDSQVKDSRPTEEGNSIRRRRVCSNCGGRFTTFERVQLRELTVIKQTGEKEPFDRDKLFRSISIALRKRPISADQQEQAASGIVRQLESAGDAEVTTSQIGNLIMDALANLDQVGYIRYASVYRNFVETKDFENFIGTLDKKVEG